MTKGKIIIVIIVLIILILTMGIFFFGKKPVPPQKITLEFWGVYDDSDIIEPFIKEFRKIQPNIKIIYRKKLFDNYQKELLDAWASGRGPDIFYIHNTWLFKYIDKITPCPEKLMSLKNYHNSFVDVCYNDFVENSYIYAVPLYVDTLALFYNKDFFNSAGIPTPPETWEDFIEDVKKLTIKDEFGNIKRAGAAIGTYKNVNRAFDILSLLMLQSGTKMVDKKRKKATFNEPVYYQGEKYPVGEMALQFYTDFANPLKEVYTWNNYMHYSIDAFYEESVAMMFNYSYHIFTIRKKAPYLNFGVSFMPQLKGREKDINYASYFGLSVSKKCKNPYWAWYFITWLVNKENSYKYLQKTKRPTARRDLVSLQENDIDLGIFAKQSLTASSWHIPDKEAVEKIFENMIESVIKGESPKEALDKAKKEVDKIWE